MSRHWPLGQARSDSALKWASARDAAAWPSFAGVSLPAGIVATAAGLFAYLYIAHPPAAPDLAAQVARAEAFRSGAVLWWSGWFGGLQLPAYSALSPLVMSTLGVATAGAIAAVVVTGVGFDLFKPARRPLAGVVALGVSAFADVLAGRVTFALGAAAAVASLALIRRRSTPFAVCAGILGYLFSPLAGLFLGVVALAVAIVQPERRRPAVLVSVTMLAIALVQVVVLPGAGQMPYPWWHMALALGTLAVVAVLCPDKVVRAACGVAAVATVLFFLVPSPVGTNVVRLVWLAAAPTVAATATLRRMSLLLATLVLATWPAIDLGIQLHRAESPSAQASFVAPLVAAWRQQADGLGSRVDGERVELVDPASQWASAYVAPTMPIARGWDRPTDRADNALFYNGTLTAASYRSWLTNMSVGWVALPLHVPLDYASVAEAGLVRQQPSYLHLVWQNASWQLFRVAHTQPLVQGAAMVSSTDHGVTFHATAPSTVAIKVRWSPYLRLTSGRHHVAACVRNTKPWTSVTVTRPGTYTLQAQFDLDPEGGSRTCAQQ